MGLETNLSQNKQEAYKRIKQVADTIAINDPSRPEYHFHAPGQWMDDPNGSIFYNGYYHVMYGTNPDSSLNRGGMPYKTGSNKWSPDEPDWLNGIDIWGHARSKDLIHWEYLPIALFPNPVNDEYFIWWGCTRINDDGIPTIIYTSIGHKKNPYDSAEQYIAYGDKDLIEWQQADDLNPIMTQKLHGNKKYYEWRDPFMFNYDDRTFIILGGKDSNNYAVVLLYEALNPQFSKWMFKGELFRYPDRKIKSIECPNIAKFGDYWVLFISPHGPVEYYVGKLDFDTCKFSHEYNGIIDKSVNFYATNLVYDDKERCILWGAIEGFKNTIGWNGAAALPRIVYLKENGKLGQYVAPEIMKLRRKSFKLNKGEKAFLECCTFEIEARIDIRDSGQILLDYSGNTIQVVFRNGLVSFGKLVAEMVPTDGKSLIRIFIDKSVLEIFVDDENCITSIIPTCKTKCNVSMKSEKFSNTMTVWEYNTENLFTYYDDKKEISKVF